MNEIQEKNMCSHKWVDFNRVYVEPDLWNAERSGWTTFDYENFKAGVTIIEKKCAECGESKEYRIYGKHLM